MKVPVALFLTAWSGLGRQLWSRTCAPSVKGTLIIGQRFHAEEDSHCWYVHGQSGHVQVVEDVVRDLLERVAAHDRT